MFSAIHHERWPLVCDEFIDDGEFIWFSYMLQNGIYRVKKGETEAEFITDFPGQLKCQFRLYKSLTAVGDLIIFVPYAATAIAVYNKKSKKIEMIPIKHMESPRKMWCKYDCKFWTSFLYGDSLFMFGRGYPGIIKMNINTFQLEYITDWVENVEMIVPKDSVQAYMFDGVCIGSKIYLALNCADAILEFDLENEVTVIHELHTGVKGFKGITYDGAYLWITPNFVDSIVKHNIKNKKNELINLGEYTSGLNPGVGPYAAPIVLKQNIMLMPYAGKHFIQINRDDNSTKKCTNLQCLLDIDKIQYVGTYDGTNSQKLVDDGKVFFINGRDASWHKYCPETSFDEKWFVTANEIQSKKICLNFLYGKPQWRWNEEKNHTIESFISYITFNNAVGNAPDKEVHTNEHSGQRIYSAIMSV